jgi:hypothetical protein
VALCSLPLTVSLFHCWHCSTVQLSIYQIYTHTPNETSKKQGGTCSRTRGHLQGTEIL